MKPHSEKEKEFNLSAKIEGQMKSIGKSLPLEDVKEFIRLIKHGLKHGIKGAADLSEPELIRNEWRIIDKLAGDKLI